jgi:hypothetical protein
VQAEKVEQPLGLAPPCPEVNVRQEQRTKSSRSGRHDVIVLASALMLQGK